MLVFGRLAGGGATLLPRSPGENLHVPRQHGAGDRGKAAGVRARRADAELLEPPVGRGGLGAPLLPAAVLLRLLRRRGAAAGHEQLDGWPAPPEKKAQKQHSLCCRRYITLSWEPGRLRFSRTTYVLDVTRPKSS